MGLFTGSIGRGKLRELLKGAPITYKLNAKGDAIQMYGQSYYRNDPTEIILNPDHTSVILYGRNGKNLYGIYGEGVLKTDTWDKWTDKQFDNKDIASVHVSPFYAMTIELRFPDNKLDGIILPKHSQVRSDGTVTIDYKGSGGDDQLPIPNGAIVVSVGMIQTSKKEYFGPVEIEPSEDVRKCKARSCFMGVFVLIVVALFFGLAFYMVYVMRKEDRAMDASDLDEELE